MTISDELKNHCTEIRVGELTAVIGDNDSDPPGLPHGYTVSPDDPVRHRPGYNGLWSLESVHRPGNLFIPNAAGMNYEFIMDGHVGAPQLDNRALEFEARSAPITFKQIDDRTVHLHQPPTPFWGLESWSEFVVREPYYIDLTFEFAPTRKTWHYNWLSVFWASYIYGPQWQESWMYIVDEDGHPVHLLDVDAKSIIRTGDPLELEITDGWGERILSDGKVRCSQPYCWGVHEGMLYMMMVHTSHRLGFWNGSWREDGKWDAVAWDIHYTVFDPQINQRYGMRARTVYTKYEGFEQVEREYRQWAERSGSPSPPCGGEVG